MQYKRIETWITFEIYFRIIISINLSQMHKDFLRRPSKTLQALNNRVKGTKPNHMEFLLNDGNRPI